MTEHSASCRSYAVHHPAPRCPLLGDPRPRTTSRPGTRREGGTEAAGLRRMGTWDSIPSQPEVPPGLLRHHPLPSRAGRSRKLQHSVLGKQTRVRPASWGSADSWLSEAGHRGQVERQGRQGRGIQALSPGASVCWAQASGSPGKGKSVSQPVAGPLSVHSPRALPSGTREVKEVGGQAVAGSWAFQCFPVLGPGRLLCRAWHLCPRTATQDAPGFENEAELVWESWEW